MIRKHEPNSSRSAGAAALIRRTKGLFAAHGMRACSGAVGIAATGDVYYRHHAGLVVDAVRHPVGNAAGAEPVVHWREKPLPIR